MSFFAKLDKRMIIERAMAAFYSQLSKEFSGEVEFWTLLRAHCDDRLKELGEKKL